MSIVTTHRPIAFAQLTAEVAAAAGLAVEDLPMSMRETVAPTEADPERAERVIRCDTDAITQTLLDDVIDAHVPADPPPSVESRLQQQIDELTDLIIFGF